ncbi:MAG TPA: hypothetical protein VJ810_15625 [Blastocatellia bacterium]|nr:hypothetical protein [Blastocatellia bacterium]
MNIMLSRSQPFLLSLATILLASIPALGQRLHPRLKEAKPGDAKQVISRVVVLPAQVSLSKDGMKGSEPLEKEAAAATPIIEKALAKALTSKNLTVLDSPFTTEALQNDEKLKYALADLRRNYDELNSKIIRKQKDIEKGRFSLGDQVLLLNQDDNIDAFIFVNAAGQRKSGGKKALGIVTLSPWMMIPFYFIDIGIVDARSGEVLAYTLTGTRSDIGKEDDKKLVEVITKSLNKLPAGTSAQKK